MQQAALQRHRAQKDQFFKTSPQSPLTDAQKAQFTGLVYYPYNPDLDLTVTVERLPEANLVQVFTTKNTIRNYAAYGTFTFTVQGQIAQLTIYETPHGFFLPFVDANAGKETYPAGRYLDLEPGAGDVFVVDFNRAYNPFCAYSDAWECPITPSSNRLAIPILAGEKLPQLSA